MGSIIGIFDNEDGKDNDVFGYIMKYNRAARILETSFDSNSF